MFRTCGQDCFQIPSFTTWLQQARLNRQQSSQVASLLHPSGEGRQQGQLCVPDPRSVTMGRLVSQIPNEDPARLARVQDAKWRTIGVCVALGLAHTCRWLCDHFPNLSCSHAALPTAQSAQIRACRFMDCRWIAMPWSGRLENAKQRMLSRLSATGASAQELAAALT